MLKEFKEFIAKGNVLDMAIGLVIGSAFTAVITSLVENIITPLLSVFTSGVDFKDWVVSIGSVNFQVGLFINSITSFLIIAFVMFVVVKAANRMRKTEEAEVTTKECPFCKTEIPLDATRCPHCTSELQARA